MLIFFIAILAFIATFLGGSIALKFKDKLHLVLGFSAGAILGVAFFDLLPESIELAGSKFGVSTIATFIALGFIIFMLVDRFIAPHHGTDDNCNNENHNGRLGAGSISFHSFLDGIAIGLAFQVSNAVGAIVTVAVLSHGFSDGINTVSLILKNGGSRKEASKWLFLDALAPALGILSSRFISLSESSLGIMLALFCGFFFYLGAADLLPESHHRHPTMLTTFMTILGMAILFIAIRIAGV